MRDVVCSDRKLEVNFIKPYEHSIKHAIDDDVLTLQHLGGGFTMMMLC